MIGVAFFSSYAVSDSCQKLVMTAKITITCHIKIADEFLLKLKRELTSAATAIVYVIPGTVFFVTIDTFPLISINL